MRTHLLGILSTLALIASASPAQGVRTFVSVNGSDSNPCTRSQPCRNFAAAVLAVDSGGEVVVLDSGGYGPVGINKSVSIISPEGVHAAIAPTSGSAIVINDPVDVVLRNLYLNSQGAHTGITVNDIAKLHVEGLVVSGFGQFGIFFAPENGGRIYLRDSIVRASGSGLRLQANSGTAEAFIDRSRFEDGSRGLEIRDRGRVDASGSVFAGNFFSGADVGPIFGETTAVLNAHACTFSGNDDGIRVSTTTGTAFAAIGNSLISSNIGAGVNARQNGIARISQNLITRNGTGVANNMGTVESAGDNAVRGNTTETTGAITPFTPI
jgi:hypothetical protein